MYTLQSQFIGSKGNGALVSVGVILIRSVWIVLDFLQVTQHLLKIMCTNAAWQRRKLGRILQDWGNLLQQVPV
jgi:hypothetical protein